MDLKQELLNLKEEVKGHFSEIADKAGVSKQAVSQVLNSEYENDKVVQAAISTRDKYRRKKDRLFKKLTSTASK